MFYMKLKDEIVSLLINKIYKRLILHNDEEDENLQM